MSDDDDFSSTVSYKSGDLLRNERYKVIDEIGEGGFGKVYLVEDAQSNNEKYLIHFKAV